MISIGNVEKPDILLPEDILNRSPSFVDGISSDEELLHRVFGCELIQEAGILLRLPQVVMATGENLLHRFFYRKSLKRFDVFTVAMACILLSAKVEEKPKIIREILFVFYHMYQKRKKLRIKPLDVGGERYTTWKNELIMMERYILKELGYCFYNIMDHPHKYILYYIKLLGGDNELAQRSWNYSNDSLRLDLCLRYPSQIIACAAIYMAARDLQFPLPASPSPSSSSSPFDEYNHEELKEDESTFWWSLLDAKLTIILLICDNIRGLYHIPKLEWLEPVAEVDYLTAHQDEILDSGASKGTDQSLPRSKEKELPGEEEASGGGVLEQKREEEVGEDSSAIASIKMKTGDSGESRKRSKRREVEETAAVRPSQVEIQEDDEKRGDGAGDRSYRRRGWREEGQGQGLRDTGGRGREHRRRSDDDEDYSSGRGDRGGRRQRDERDSERSLRSRLNDERKKERGSSKKDCDNDDDDGGDVSDNHRDDDRDSRRDRSRRFGDRDRDRGRHNNSKSKRSRYSPEQRPGRNRDLRNKYDNNGRRGDVDLADDGSASRSRSRSRSNSADRDSDKIGNRSEAIPLVVVASDGERVVLESAADNDESTNSPIDNINRVGRGDDGDEETFSIDSIEGI